MLAMRTMRVWKGQIKFGLGFLIKWFQLQKILTFIPPSLLQHDRQTMNHHVEETPHNQAQNSDEGNEKCEILGLKQRL